MAWSILIVLLVLWLLGFSFNVGGNLIHALLVIALVVFIARMLN
ncbi:MAG: lmo0937 family membrane protein [Patescibacteria group bacterium]